jgi:hypothetical protein
VVSLAQEIAVDVEIERATFAVKDHQQKAEKITPKNSPVRYDDSSRWV